MEPLPSYKEFKTRLPLSPTQRFFIERSRDTVRDILNGTDPRLLLIVGPCSIHDHLSAKEFAFQLSHLVDTLSSQFFFMMRIYCEKPRTTSGWKGFLYDPLLDGSHEIELGIEWTRQLLQELTDMRIPVATEFLDPLTAFYYDDLITWGSIGARTVSSQIHRQLASGLSMPIGFKNCIAGNISTAVNGALAASHSHTYVRICENGQVAVGKTAGNRDAHIVLRGGEAGPNYDPYLIADALARLEQVKLPLRLLVDCSHDNSGKQYDRQPEVFQSVMHQIVEGNPHIRGLMLESHLHAGNQPLLKNRALLQYGVSITDGCLDWNSTAHLITWGAEYLQQQFNFSQNLKS